STKQKAREEIASAFVNLPELEFLQVYHRVVDVCRRKQVDVPVSFLAPHAAFRLGRTELGQTAPDRGLMSRDVSEGFPIQQEPHCLRRLRLREYQVDLRLRVY